MAMKRLILLGGGHAHVHVLKAFGAAPPDNTEVTLVAPYHRQVYSGMLPGWIAGHYELEDCIIPLAPLAQQARATFEQTAATAIDFAANEVVCVNGKRLGFDVLSIDIGSVANVGGIPGAVEHALAVRPIEDFITRLGKFKAALATHAGPPIRVVVVGAGAGGVEVALAMQHAGARADTRVSTCVKRAVDAAPACTLSIISASNTLPGKVGAKISAALRNADITLYAGVPASHIHHDAVVLANGLEIGADLVIAALGAAAADWPAQSGVACNTQGYILTNSYLQSVSHPNVFAVGDCASMVDHSRPKSGVYAVRAGPPLATNLLAALSDRPLAPYQPQQRSLYLISTGRKHAIGSWGPVTWQGEWVWRWKDRIDRAFITKYRSPT